MTSPPRQTRLLNGPMMVGIAVVALLVVAVVVVLFTRDSSDDEAAASTSSAPAGSVAPSYDKDPDFVTSQGHDLEFDYPMNAGDFDSSKWIGPDDGKVQDIEVASLIRYPACAASDSGSDLSMAVLPGDGDNPTDAAVAAMKTLEGLTLSAGSDYDITEYGTSDAVDLTTGTGLDGAILSTILTDPDADNCDTDEYRLTTFAAELASGDMVALVLVNRNNGETVVSPDELAGYVDAIIATARDVSPAAEDAN